MPTYRYECAKGHYTRIVQHMRDPLPDALPCKVCKRKATYSFGPPQISVFEPYITHIGDNQPKLVRNAAEAADIERKFQVAEIGSEELKRRSDPDEMRRRRELRNREAMASLGSMKDDYDKAEAELKQWGKEYANESRNRERAEFEQFQRIVESGHVNH